MSTTQDQHDQQEDLYAGSAETSEGRVFTVSGQDWDQIADGLAGGDDEERIVVNMGPQHPSTHGVLRLILEIEGETVTEARCGIGYLHTGIEKNMEFRSWVQGTTFCTRMDYLAPLFNEATYSFGVERLLGIEGDIPERAQVIRVLMMELNRISSHLVAIATGGMELGALTVMTIGFRERELVLDLFELITGLRMNHAYIRPGGVAQDLPAGALEEISSFIALMRKRLPEYAALCNANPIFKARLEGVGHLDLEGCLALGLTGPPLRATGYPWDLRKTQPYCGYEDYEFDVQTWDTADSYGRFRIRLNEMWESLRIVEQATARLAGLEGAPIMVADKKIAWPSQLSIGSDGMGNSLDHIRHIMGESMEALIHHFKLVTEGFRVPPGQAYVPIESPRGELGAHVVSDGGTRPFRAHFRDPSFTNLQATSVMSEGGMISDVIVAIASIDPVMGGGRPVTLSDTTPSDTTLSDTTLSDTTLSDTTLSETTLGELREIAARYPQKRSGLLPMLHLVQSVQGRVTPEGIETCAAILDLSPAEVSGVATFYTMYKRKPVGDYHVGVCTNTLCAVLGGDEIFKTLQDHLEVGNDETTEDAPGKRSITLEHLECNAACDYAPVMMVNWEFMDDQTPESAVRVVDDLRDGTPVTSTRGPRLCTWREAERVLAGFPDGLADEGPAAGPASLVGLGIARDRGWTAPYSPEGEQPEPTDEPTAAGDPAPAVPEGAGRREEAAHEADEDVDEAAQVEADSPSETPAAEKKEAQ